MKKSFIFVCCSLVLSIMVTNANDIKQLISLVTEAQANDWVAAADPVESSDYENPYAALVHQDTNCWQSYPCSYKRLYYRTSPSGYPQTSWRQEPSINCCKNTQNVMQACDIKDDNIHCIHVEGTMFYTSMTGFTN